VKIRLSPLIEGYSTCNPQKKKKKKDFGSNRSRTTRSDHLISFSAILNRDTRLPPDGRGEETDEKWRELNVLQPYKPSQYWNQHYVKNSVRTSRKPQTPINQLMQLTEIFTFYSVVRNEYTVSVEERILVLKKLTTTTTTCEATTVTWYHTSAQNSLSRFW